MKELILDLGSGNTCQNDIKIIERMINEVDSVNTGRTPIIFKMQLWSEENPQGDNVRLEWDVFDYAFEYAKEKGYAMAASIFDCKSLWHLLQRKVPFVKIANRPDLMYLWEYVPRGVHVYASERGVDLKTIDACGFPWDKVLACLSYYPCEMDALIERYEEGGKELYFDGISDHSIGIALMKEFIHDRKIIIEKHLKLSDSTGNDAGSFAVTPQELKGII